MGLQLGLRELWVLILQGSNPCFCVTWLCTRHTSCKGEVSPLHWRKHSPRGRLALCVHCTLLLDQVPPKSPQAHPFQTTL